MRRAIVQYPKEYENGIPVTFETCERFVIEKKSDYKAYGEMFGKTPLLFVKKHFDEVLAKGNKIIVNDVGGWFNISKNSEIKLLNYID